LGKPQQYIIGHRYWIDPLPGNFVHNQSRLARQFRMNKGMTTMKADNISKDKILKSSGDFLILPAARNWVAVKFQTGKVRDTLKEKAPKQIAQANS
jgi:hypothetical protein